MGGRMRKALTKAMKTPARMHRPEGARDADGDQAQQDQQPDVLVKGALQPDGEEQHGHAEGPGPGAVAVEQAQDQPDEPGKEEVAAPGGVTDAVMGQEVPVKVEEQEQGGETDARRGAGGSAGRAARRSRGCTG